MKLCDGVNIPTILKKGEKLLVYIPIDVAEAMLIDEGDEVSFVKDNDGTFKISKVGMEGVHKSKEFDNARNITLNTDELAVLKRLDTIRYSNRTKDTIKQIFDLEEQKILQVMLKRGIITLFKKSPEDEQHYSISKDVYDKFLYGKREYKFKRPDPIDASAVKPPVKKMVSESIQEPKVEKAWELKLKEQNKYAEILESKGYIVLNNDVEASSLSTLMEESIRRGLVLGTRAFNKKFYVGLRSYIAKNSAKIMKVLETGSAPISKISKESGIEEEGARTILYLMAESGDIAEVRKDVFSIA